MAYVEVGQGDPIVLLHGNPTSSYLWRNVLPHPELIGMGDSDKLENSDADRYTYAEHCEYLFALWDQIGLGDKIIMVLHDWGSALGFDWAMRNRDRVQGIVYMEAIVTPLTWADWPENARRAFHGLPIRKRRGDDS
jgi:haloalkane dehalogenase